MRHLLPLLLFCVLAPLADAGKIIAREGAGRLELHEGRMVLHLAGTPYEMGYQHGKLLAKTVRANMNLILHNKGEFGKKPEYVAYKVFRRVMHWRLDKYIPRRFKEELRGLAAGSGARYEDLLAANLFPEAFHCSGMALSGKATHDGSMYHVRILDYMTRLGLQDVATVMIHSPKGKNRWLNVGFAGFIGTVTGMNDRQIAIGEMGGRGLLYWNGIPMAFLMRDALERAGTLAEAVEIFRKAKRTCEYYYVISDAKIRDARGIWATGKEFETVKPGQTYGFVGVEKPGTGAAGNKSFMKDVKVEVSTHRILFKDKQGQVEGFIARQPEDCIVMSGYDRYQHFINRLMPRYGKVDHRALIEMIKRPVSMGSNLHNAIFHPSTGEVWVAIAGSDGSPACNQRYIRYQLPLHRPARPAPAAAATSAMRR